MSLLVESPLSWFYQLLDAVNVKFAEWPGLTLQIGNSKSKRKSRQFFLCKPIRKRPRRQLICAIYPPARRALLHV